MTVLSDRDIHQRCALGMVTPYFTNNVQPASIDLRLGSEFIIFPRHFADGIDLADVRDQGTKIKLPNDDSFFRIGPGEFILGVTHEQVQIPNDLVARIEGKSSIGRIGLMVHVTAGFIDPGFRGHITLEIVNLRNVPIILRPGKEICQLSFHIMNSIPQRPYSGRYQDAEGVEASLYGRTRDE